MALGAGNEWLVRVCVPSSEKGYHDWNFDESMLAY
jgi:hypothetical protein